MLFGIICLLAACSDVRTPKHTHAEDYCADSETARLFRRSKWTGLDNDLKIILMLDRQDFEIYGAFDEDKDGIHEYAEYYIGTLRIYNDIIFTVTTVYTMILMNAFLTKRCK